MMIYLMDADSRMTACWQRDFEKEKDVRIVNQDFMEFMDSHPEIDCLASAGNSFGLMTGGLDGAYLAYFGTDLQMAVQKKIREEHLGEQPVGTSLFVEIPHFEPLGLIHTPSMRIPQPVIDPRIIYSCMRSTLVMAVRQNREQIMIPAFGHLTGRVKAEIVSELMYRAYLDVKAQEKNREKMVRHFSEVIEIDDVLLHHLGGR